MNEIIQFHIDGFKGSYIFKIQPPSMTIIKPYERLDIQDKREKVINKVMEIRKKILLGENLTESEEHMHKNLIKLGVSIQKLMGIQCVKDLKELLEKYHNLLILTNDPVVPWELLSIDNKPACLNNSIGRIITGRILSAEFEKKEKNVIHILFIGDPSGDLESSIEEIKNIKLELKTAIDQGYIKTSTLIGSEATTANIIELMKTNEFDIIHYSGHAFFDEKNPENSGVKLADKDITAKEISEYTDHLPEIVFINACESAQANIELEGEKQVSGLAEAFIQAGTKTFIGSIWPIDNKDAINFAYSFYQNLLQEDKTIGECVLESKNELYNSKSSHAWASFLMFGDPNTIPFTFSNELKNNVEKLIIQPIEQPFQLRALKNDPIIKPIVVDPEIISKIIPFGSENLILKKIQDDEFNIILGPAGMGKTNCKYLLSQNDKDIKFVEIDKRFLKGINNTEFILRMHEELKTLAEKHHLVVLVLDEEQNRSDMTAENLIEIIHNLFESGCPTKLHENLRVLMFLRTKSYKSIKKEGKIPHHWKVQKTWLEGISLTDESIEKFLAIHKLSKDNFTKPAYNTLIERISSRGWIYPIFADNLLLYLEKNRKEQFTRDDIENVQISDDIIDTVKYLVYNIRTEAERNIWSTIVSLNKTFELNPPLWLIKTTLKSMLNVDLSNIDEILRELLNDKLILEEKDEIIIGEGGILGDKESYIYSLFHDIYYEVTPKKEYDGDFTIELIEKIKAELNNNLEKAKGTSNIKILRAFLKNVLQRFYFLSATEYIDKIFIDKVLEYLNSVDLDIQKTLIPDLERLVFDFYARNSIESIAKLYLFIGNYHEKSENILTATDYYNIGCHLLEVQKIDSSDYRFKNGNLYNKLMDDLKTNIDKFENKCTVELASWQWKAAALFAKSQNDQEISNRFDKGIEVRKILVDAFMETNKSWAAAELQWLAEMSELNDKLDNTLEYYNDAIKLLEPYEHHIFNIRDYLSRLSHIYEILNRFDEKEKIEAKTSEINEKIRSMSKSEGLKVHIISGAGDLFSANQIHYKILQEINATVTIKPAAPEEKVDILIPFGTPLVPNVGELIFNYMDRDIINKMLRSSGYWIKKPTREGDPLVIAIAGYTMFDTRREAENFIEKEDFKNLINLI
ncbi:MAG: CHAT domain-containing protein [Candidatus Hermodarchaeota archaeon]